jgi:hypothetical protein
VFDGHGGHVCAEYCRRNVHVLLASEEDITHDPGGALRQSLVKARGGAAPLSLFFLLFLSRADWPRRRTRTLARRRGAST